MNEMILRGIYQVMVDMVNEMKRLNDNLESGAYNMTANLITNEVNDCLVASGTLGINRMERRDNES